MSSNERKKFMNNVTKVYNCYYTEITEFLEKRYGDFNKKALDYINKTDLSYQEKSIAMIMINGTLGAEILAKTQAIEKLTVKNNNLTESILEETKTHVDKELAESCALYKTVSSMCAVGEADKES